VDFFPPVVDDPYDFGRVAAANALSDVYAMGGRPIAALSVVGFPKGLEMAVLGDILRGAAEKVREAGAVVAGGHTIVDEEVKFGLSVTGLVHPDRIVSNARARPGDALVLTKRLGTGFVTSAIKLGKCAEDLERKVVESMARLNKDAAEEALAAGVRAGTDVTGFGLLGHASHLADESRVTLRFRMSAMPVFEEAYDLQRKKIGTIGQKSNRAYLGERVSFAAGIGREEEEMLFDPQTSGGLLVAVPGGGAAALVARLRSRGVEEAAVVGEVLPRGGRSIEVVR